MSSASEPPGPALLEVRSLTVEHRRGWRNPPVRAVNDVSFDVWPGETLGVVGESGSGKTTIGRALLGLVTPRDGRVRFAGEDITSVSRGRRRELSADMQMIFQDPYSSLNPARTVGQTLVEPLLVHRSTRRAEGQAAVGAMLTRVGLDPDAADRYPGQFSGGQRQRIAIARALMASPRFVICDEPVSALDLSVQAQVLNLLSELQQDLALSYLFISHDLSVVRHISHRIIVLYQGQVMEAGDAATLSTSPAHPYTQALLAAAPVPEPQLQDARRRKRRQLGAPSNGVLPSDGAGCPFAARCPLVVAQCRRIVPSLEPGPGETLVACHRRSTSERIGADEASRQENMTCE